MSLPSPLVFLLISIIFIRLIEVAFGSRFWSNKPLGEAARVLVHATTFAVPYALTCRPLTSFGLAVLLAFAFSIVDVLKKRVVYEPVVFSDLGLLGQIVRHPELYLMDRPGPAIAAVVLFLVALITSVWLEHPLSPSFSAYVPLTASWIALFLARSSIRARLAPVLLDEKRGWGSISFGLVTSLVLQFVCWLGSQRVAFCSLAASTPQILPPCDIVLIQLESFVDISPDTSSQSSAWAELASRSRLYGKMTVGARGANTMRTEHSVLSGVSNEALGFDRFDPYLRRPLYRHGAAVALKKLGWDTVFVHPNDLDFFRRSTALPLLGFDKLVGKDAFAPEHFVGPYVGDRAVMEKIVAELEAPGGAKFVFAVTMENHGPWKAGRLQGVKSGMPSYVAHQKNMYESLETLFCFASQSAKRTVIILYGDHVPALPLPAHLNPYQTDFLIFDSQYAGSASLSKPVPAERLLYTALNSLQDPSII